MTVVSLMPTLSPYFIPLLSRDDKGDVQIYVNCAYGDRFANGYDLQNTKVLAITKGEEDLASGEKLNALLAILQHDFELENGSYVNPLYAEITVNETNGNNENTVEPETPEVLEAILMKSEAGEESEEKSESSENENLLNDTEPFDLMPSTAFEVPTKTVEIKKDSEAQDRKFMDDYKQLVNGIRILKESLIQHELTDTIENNLCIGMIEEGAKIISNILPLSPELKEFYLKFNGKTMDFPYKHAFKSLSLYLDNKLATAMETKKITYGEEMEDYALVFMNIAFSKDEKSIASQYNGIYYLIAKNYSSAISAFNQAIALNSAKYQLYYYRAATYAKLNLYTLAIHDLKKSIELHPDDPRSKNLLAGIEQNGNCPDVPVKTCFDDIVTTPKVESFELIDELNSGDKRVDVAFNNAKIAKTKGMTSEQFQLLKFAKTELEKNLNDEKTNHAYSKVCFQVAEYYDGFKTSQGYEQALKFWNKAYENVSKNTIFERIILSKRAFTYSNIKRRDSAKADYIQAIQKSPVHSKERKQFALLYYSYLKPFNESEKQEFLQLTRYFPELNMFFAEEIKGPGGAKKFKNQQRIQKGINLLKQNTEDACNEGLKLFAKIPDHKINISFIPKSDLNIAFHKLSTTIFYILNEYNDYTFTTIEIPKKALEALNKVHLYASLIRKLEPTRASYTHYIDSLANLQKREFEKAVDNSSLAILADPHANSIAIYYYHRAQAYFKLLNYTNALHDIKYAIQQGTYVELLDKMELLRDQIMQELDKIQRVSSHEEKIPNLDFNTISFMKSIHFLSCNDIKRGVELALASKKDINTCKGLKMDDERLHQAKLLLGSSLQQLTEKVVIELKSTDPRIRKSELDELDRQAQALEKISNDAGNLSLVYCIKSMRSCLDSNVDDAYKHVMTSIKYMATTQNLLARARIYMLQGNHYAAHQDYFAVLQLESRNSEAMDGIKQVGFLQSKEHKHAIATPVTPKTKVAKVEVAKKIKVPVSSEAVATKNEFDELKISIKTHIEKNELKNLDDALQKLNVILKFCNDTKIGNGSDNDYLVSTITKPLVTVSTGFIEAIKKVEETNKNAAISIYESFEALSEAPQQMVAQFRNRKKTIQNSQRQAKIKSIRNSFAEIDQKLEGLPKDTKIVGHITTLTKNKSLSIKDAQTVLQSTAEIYKKYSSEDFRFLKEKMQILQGTDKSLTEVKKELKEKIELLQQKIAKYENIRQLRTEIFEKNRIELKAVHTKTLQNIRRIDSEVQEIENFLTESSATINKLTCVKAISSKQYDIAKKYEEKIATVTKLIDEATNAYHTLESTRSIISIGSKSALQPIETYDSILPKLNQSFDKFKQNTSNLMEKIEMQRKKEIEMELEKQKLEEEIEKQKLKEEKDKQEFLKQQQQIDKIAQEFKKTLSQKQKDIFENESFK